MQTCLVFQKGLVLGVYEDCGAGTLKLSSSGSKFDTENGNRITELLKGYTSLVKHDFLPLSQRHLK